MLQCRICQAQGPHQLFGAREMMFGVREKFDYFECSDCGCVQIREIPTDLSRYYPAEYYSFAPGRRKLSGGFKRFLRRRWLAHAMGRANPLGWLYARLRGVPECAGWLAETELNWQSAILDVGGGSGSLAASLWELGFSNLTAIDPYLERENVYGKSLRVLRRKVGEIGGEFDLIMFHHSFEHIAEQDATLEQAAARLKPGGQILIRIPMVAFAWRKYRTDWVQLDAPRHLYLHTKRSMRILTARHGLRIRKVKDDSTARQFWVSEQYQHDIPLRDARSYSQNPTLSLFSRQQIDEFARKAQRLNAQGQGDQAAFYIVRG
jgi:SAM-dependent methyltransferase